MSSYQRQGYHRTFSRAVAPVLAHVQASYNLDDVVALEREATLALNVAWHTRDHHGAAIATLFLGLVRRDLRLLQSAARNFEMCYDWLNAAVAWCVCAEFEPDQGRKLALLYKAPEHIEHARRQLAQRGDVDMWRRAGDIERAIHAAIERAANGEKWIEGVQ